MKKQCLILISVVLLILTAVVPTAVQAEGEYKEVIVPAIWYPVDKDTGEVISGLNPITTVPDLYLPPESARWQQDTAQYEINLAALLKSGTGHAEYNFNRTNSILFTNRFHKVVAQGYTWPADPPSPEHISSVLRVKYGTTEFENLTEGIQGITRTPYQKDETLHLYLATKENAFLSEASYQAGEVEVTSEMSSAAIQDILLDHVEKVTYYDFTEQEELVLDLTTLNQLFIFDHTANAFITEGAEYKNFLNGDIASLPAGTYEAVFPIYWQVAIPDWFGGAAVHVRNRYKIDDTFHFSFTKQGAAAGLVDVTGRKTWEDHNNLYGLRPASITINLLGNGQVIKSQTVTEADAWAWSFTDLPSQEAGEPLTYTITENSVPNYSSKVVGYNITNTYIPDKISISVVIIWEDGNDWAGVRPESVTLELWADGVNTGKTLILSKFNNWTGAFRDLWACIAGKKINYTIKVKAIEGGYVSTITGDAVTGFQVLISRLPNGESVPDHYITDISGEIPLEKGTSSTAEYAVQALVLTPSPAPSKSASPVSTLPKTGENCSTALYLTLTLSAVSLLLMLLRNKIKS